MRNYGLYSIVQRGVSDTGEAQNVDDDWGLPIAQPSVIVRAEIVANSGAVAYLANDVISAGASSTTPTKLTLARREGQTLMLNRIRVATNNPLTLINIRLAVYASNPGSIPADNEPWPMLYANLGVRQGLIELPIAGTGGTGSDCASSFYQGPPVMVKCASGSKDLHFVLIAGAGFTAAANQKWTLEVGALAY